MEIGWFEVIALVLVVAALLYYAFPTESRLKRAGHAFARKRLAYADSGLVEAFDRAELFERRMTAVVFGCMCIPGVFAGHFAGGLNDLAPAVLAVGMAVISGIRLLRAGREFLPPSGRAVVARTRTIRVRDYVPPVLLTAAAAAALLLAAIAAVATHAALVNDPALLSADQGFRIAGAAGVVVLLALTGPWYLVALCRRPEPAVDASHLYLQDAWRATQMQAAVGAWLIAAMLASFPGLWLAPEWLTDSAVIPVGGLAVVGAALWYADRATLWFRERLWPTLPPGYILRPGDVGHGA